MIGNTARDRIEPKTEYKGRPTYCLDKFCPCRPCWHPHDCGHTQKVYNEQGAWVANQWIVHMECATRYNNGCSYPKPDPEHIPYKTVKRCKRCNQMLGEPT